MESMEEIFAIGHRDTKHMPFPYKLEKGWNRGACSYSYDYAKKPLGDHLGNNQLAATFLANNRGGNQGGGDLPIAGTTYQANHGPQTRDTLRKAKLPIQTP